MVRRIAGAALALMFVAGLAVAGDAKQAKGTVKTVAMDSITITDDAAKDWTFVVDQETVVKAKGATHKMNKLKADGKPATITEFVAAENKVVIQYAEKDGKTIAKEVHLK